VHHYLVDKLCGMITIHLGGLILFQLNKGHTMTSILTQVAISPKTL